MKRHEILQDFKGSQDGRVTEDFRAGTQADLSDYLAAIVVPEGWARPIEAPGDPGGEAPEASSAKPPRARKGRAG